jgi:D-alanine-D-alanine ligase
MNSFLLGKRVAVLCGGPSSEREVSLRSGSAVTKALRALGADAFEIDVRGSDFSLPDGTELAFNALHGTFGEDGTVQAILENKGITYTGEGVEGSRVAFDKIESKRRFVERGVPTAPYVTLQKGEILNLAAPYVVKVPCQGSRRPACCPKLLRLPASRCPSCVNELSDCLSKGGWRISGDH